MSKIRLDAGNYIKLLGNVPNRNVTKTPVSVRHGIIQDNLSVVPCKNKIAMNTNKDTGV